MTMAPGEMSGFQGLLEQKQADLVRSLQIRDELAIERSADQKEAIGPKRLAAVPWAPRCIKCQGAADRDARESSAFAGQVLAEA
jgi:RNA polymerase-binding transcription factor DksA